MRVRVRRKVKGHVGTNGCGPDRGRGVRAKLPDPELSGLGFAAPLGVPRSGMWPWHNGA